MKKMKKKITEERQKEWFDAVGNRDIKTVQEMIKEGIDVNITTTPNGWTALHWGCYYKQINMIKFLIKNGADINIKNNEHLRTPLHFACYLGNLDITKLLIENGADITAKDKDGDAPLDDLKSYKEKHEELIEWIAEEYPEKALEAIANENIQSKGVGL